jgi:YD repeat-containing protein
MFFSRQYAAKALTILASLAVLAPLGAHANVSIKNGNFFIGYTDIVYPGGFEPKIERVYNSKTPFKGMFGWGWGNEYEVYLAVSADGSVVVHEYGGGAENRFVPLSFSAAELDGAVEMIAKTAQQVGGVGSADQLASYKKRLKTDAEYRNKEWEKFRTQGRLKPRQLKEGTQLVSNRFSFQYIKKLKDGYFRVFDNGRLEKFDEDGKLVKIQDKNNNFIDLTYGKDGKLQRLVDNFNRKMFFSFNTQGLLEKIEGENGKVANYRYNAGGELAASKDVDGNSYTFKYDSKNHHNMTEIGYSDKTTMVMNYWGPDKFENIRSVKDRDNTTTEYTYDLNPSDRDKYAVSVSVKSSEGKNISNSKYEYFLKRRADGEEWTYRLNSTLDGERTETVYQEGTGLPLSIKRGNELTAFEYDNKGHVTKKTTPSEITELRYDPKVSKVSFVSRYPKGGKARAIWSQFNYDAKGNLLYAKNSDKKEVRLFYDNNGRIKSMIDQSKRQIQFKYNENSKPIQITDPKLGSINVSYTNSGELKKVESSAGRKIAVQVTTAFQNLLDIIRPAGVSLSF